MKVTGNKTKNIIGLFLIGILLIALRQPAFSQTPTLQQYTALPPFISQNVPPLVMIVMSKDHKEWYKAYTDVIDLDGITGSETTYKDTVDYYGYFDFNKCYVYDTGQGRFEPSAAATGTNLHYCTNAWSGNFLNWGTMTRIDVARKVLYGGHRKTPETTSETVLQRALLPRDVHSFAKPYKGADLSSLVPTAFNWAAGITLCNLNTSSAETSSQIFMIRGFLPYAASQEVKQCVNQYNQGPALSQAGSNSPANATAVGKYVQYSADVQVCVSTMLEPNCLQYGSATLSYKPSGLIEKFGIDRKGTLTDTTDDVVQMKFGLIMGSNGKNLSGGVLRSKITDINTEIDKNTGMFLSSSKIIKMLENINVTSVYDFTTGNYTDCNIDESSWSGFITDGQCTRWGNPIGEMFYEAIRYFQGRKAATPEFVQNDGASFPNDTWDDPYGPVATPACPYCSKPFILMVSDIFPSYDSDQLPGSKWPKSITLDSPAIPSVQTLLDNAKMNTLQGITSGNVFVGESTTNDKTCSPKPGDFKTIRGLCIEEPTKQGSFYIAGLAHYARTTSLSTINPSLKAFKNQSPSKDAQLKITTYALATASPLPQIDEIVSGQKVTIVPSFRDGCPKIYNPGNPYRACSSIGQDGDGSRGEIVDFQYCQDDPNFADVDWFNGAGTSGNNFQECFDVMWDDAEYGHDFDLDLRYRIYIKSDATSITVKTRGVYASAGHLGFAGFIIKGVGLANDGEYLDIACGNGGAAGSTDCDPWNKITTTDSATPTVNDFFQRTFILPTTPDPSQILNDPLWYASKYGGFNDIDNDGGSGVPPTPNLQDEWDKDKNLTPDTYFFAANPLKMEEALTAALFDILSRASSGTSVSVLATTSSGEGAVYQAYFFPSVFDSNNEVSWLGFLQGLFFDSDGQLREDTNQDGRLITTGPNADKVIETFFDTQNQETRVRRYDVDANGIKTGSPTEIKLTSLKPIWEAGKVLAKRKLASNPRTVLTWVDKNNDGKVQAATEYIDFSVTNETTLRPYLRAASAAEGTNIINFIHGTDFTGSRIRKVTVEGETDTVEWKLGDIVYSSPVAVGAPQERYDLKFKDSSYNDFFRKYKSRREVVYVGGNDGMLHAFNSGFFHPGDDPTTTDVEHGWFTTAGPLVTDKNRVLGEEIWGFIPQELLPHLKWLTQPAYDKSKHIYFVDGSSRITDAQIFTAEAQCATNINDVNCIHPGGWGTVLIGSMRMGGSVIKADLNGNGNTTDAGEDRFRSAYFALDITNPEKNPVLLWVYKESDLGFTTTWPAVLRFDSTHWYMLFGSGPITYNGERDNGLATNKFESTVSNYGQIYVVDLKDGTLVKKMVADGTELYSFMGDPVAYDFPLNYATDVAYIGKATYLKPTAKWAGKVFRLLMQDSSTNLPTSDSTKWTLSVMFNPQKPVLVKPTATFDKSNNLWVYFGTGRYFSVGANSDQTDVTLQAYYGIKDSGTNGCWTGAAWKANCSGSLSSANLFNATSTAVSDTGALTGCSCSSTSFSSLITSVIKSASNEGWVVDLTAGERILQESTILGGIVAVTSYTPNSLDICVSQGTNKLYAMYFETGTAYSASVIGVTSGTVDRVKDLGLGLPSKINMVVSRTTVTGFVQSSTGEIIQIKGITLPFKVQTGPRSFRERSN